jgi:hypothetical protein
MREFSKNAYYLLLWRTILVALIAAVLMVTHTIELKAALLVGANIALLFSVGLIAWTSQHDEEQIVRTEAWRTLMPEERPAGKIGRFCALNCLEEIAFRFAKASAAVAAALAGAVLAISVAQ